LETKNLAVNMSAAGTGASAKWTNCWLLEVGKQADIMIVKGQPARNIRDIEKVELVFKDGIGCDSKELIASVKGQVGIH